jgi:hypothetical protein
METIKTPDRVPSLQKEANRNEAPRRLRRGIKMDLFLYLYPDFDITP